MQVPRMVRKFPQNFIIFFKFETNLFLIFYLISKNKFARYSIFEVKENFNKFNENKNSIFSYESKMSCKYILFENSFEQSRVISFNLYEKYKYEN